LNVDVVTVRARTKGERIATRAQLPRIAEAVGGSVETIQEGSWGEESKVFGRALPTTEVRASADLLLIDVTEVDEA
jgi:hypothetical protein